jgi:hypothetical protein
MGRKYWLRRFRAVILLYDIHNPSYSTEYVIDDVEYNIVYARNSALAGQSYDTLSSYSQCAFPSI